MIVNKVHNVVRLVFEKLKLLDTIDGEIKNDCQKSAGMIVK